MKKLVRFAAISLLVAAAVLTVIYRAVNQVPSSELPLNEQVYEIFTEGGCLSCHSADPVLPFYAKIPVAGDIVMTDVDSGYRAFDMTKFMEDLKAGNEVNAVELAKVEKSLVIKEMKRMYEFGRLAINFYDTDNIIVDLRDAYNIYEDLGEYDEEEIL